MFDRSRRIVVRLSFVSVSLVVTFVLLELALHLLGDPLVGRHHSRLAVEHDPIRGWRNVPNLLTEFTRSEYRVHLRYNSRGIRGPEITPAKPPGVRRILILGDSFVDAYQVEEHERISARLEAELAALGVGPVEVIGLGVGGYSTDQELLWLRSEGMRLDPDLVVYMYFFNDTYENTSTTYLERGSKPRFVEEHGGLVLTNVPVPPPRSEGVLGPLSRWLLTPVYAMQTLISTPWLARPLIEAGIYRLPDGLMLLDEDQAAGPLLSEFVVYLRDPPPLAHDARRITQLLVREMKHEVEQHGAVFRIMRIPLKFELLSQTDFDAFAASLGINPDALDRQADRRAVSALCAEEGIELIDPFDRFVSRPDRGKDLSYREELHWNAAGHALAAEILAERLAPPLRPSQGVPRG